MLRALDTETSRFRPAFMAPLLVTLCIAAADTPTELYDSSNWQAPLREALQEETVWHNGPYDLAVALTWGDEETQAAIVDAYDNLRIYDTMLFERLAEVTGKTKRKGLGLASVGAFYGITVDGKDGEVRTDYGRFWGTPAADLPEAHRTYALSDPDNTLMLWERQQAKHGRNVCKEDCALVARKQFWLQLVRNYGLRIDPDRLGLLEAETDAALDKLTLLAEELGFLRETGSRYQAVIKAAVIQAYEPKFIPVYEAYCEELGYAAASERLVAEFDTENPGLVPVTAKDRDWDKKRAAKLDELQAKGEYAKIAKLKPWRANVSTSKDVLQESGSWELEQLARWGEWSAVKNKDIKLMRAGTEFPISTKWGLANTLRTTSSAPNLMNLSAEHGTERQVSVRECFVPRAGYCYLDADHTGLELVTLAQVCVSELGLHNMADKINAGMDLHCDVAAVFLGIPYEQAKALHDSGDKDFKEVRNCMKILNFGRPGGMGARTLRMQARKIYNIDRSLSFWQGLIKTWERANPDGMAYLQWIKTLQVGEGFSQKVFGTHSLYRHGITFCSAANTPFQSLGAAVEADVGWAITKACYWDKSSALYGCKLVNFIHDEFLLECPIGQEHEAAIALEEIMCGESARRLLPDVRITSEAVAMDRWSKSAKRVLDENGRLGIYRCPEPKMAA